MSTLFSYTWIDETGKKHISSEYADSKKHLEYILESRNVVILDIIEGKSDFLSRLIYQISNREKKYYKVKRRELIEFTIFLATLIDAGVSVVQALKEFAEEVDNNDLKFIVDNVYHSVLSGESLKHSLQNFPDVFNQQFCQLVGAGEQTGTLPNSLRELQGYMEWSEQIDADIAQATTYPKIILIVLSIFVLYLFSAVIPKITAIFTDIDLQLPTITVIVMTISNFALKTWWIWVILGVGTPIVVKYISKRNEKFAYKMDELSLKIPFIGGLLNLIHQARFVYNFAVLHRAGISIIKNLDLAKQFSGNKVFSKAIGDIKTRVREGIPISQSMKETGVFSGLVVRMVNVGENSGKLDETLEKVSEYYNKEIPRRIKKVLTILEPTLILFLVGIVGAVAISIFLPMLSLGDNIL